MDLGALIASLGCDSSELRRAEGEFRKLDQTAGTAMGNIKSFTSSAMSQMASMAGIVLGVAGAFYAVEKAVRFSIDAQEEFRLKTIMIGTGLTNIAKEGQGSFEKMFQQNFRFAQQMYEEIRKEDAKRFASADDLMTAYNAMVQKGYAVRLDEVDALGVLTDKIKLATAGQNTQMQIQQEIRALMDGQARAGSLLGVELANRLGPGWKKLVQQHRQAGDLLQWLASMWPGIAAAAKEVENTIEAQSTTLSGNLKSIGRQGMLGIYELTVNILKDMNEYLREHEQDIIVGLVRGWATMEWTVRRVHEEIDKIQDATKINVPDKVVKDMTTLEIVAKNFKQAFETSPTAIFSKMADDAQGFWQGMDFGLRNWGRAGDILINEGMFGSLETLQGEWEDITSKWRYLSEHELTKPVKWMIESNLDAISKTIEGIADFLRQPINWVINAVVSGLPSWMVSGTTMPAPPSAKPSPRLTYPDKSLETAKYKAEMAAKGYTKGFLPGMWMKSFGEDQTIATKPPVGANKGGKSADAEINRLNSLFDTLTKDIARLSGGKWSEIGANYTKTIEQIYKKERDQVATQEELAVLAKTRETLQKQELEEKFWLTMSKESGNAYASIGEQAKQWLKDHQNIQGAAAVVEEWRQRKTWEEDVKNYGDRLGLEKSFYDQAAQLSPVLSDQIAFKKKALDLEIEINRWQLQTKLVEMERKGIISSALADEYRARQAIIDQQKRFNLEMENNKGFSGWAWGRAKEADQKNTLKDMMGGLESGFQNAFSSGLQGVLDQDEKTLKKIGKTMFQGLLGEVHKGGITRLFDSAAKLMRPSGPAGLSSLAKDGSASGLTQAAQGLQQASDGFNLNSAQFGLAAGGLLLSGIGIMTNSQALVIAGTVLQIAGMAIQLYEALTATMDMTAAGALTIAAGELSVAAWVLMAAAAVPFFHGGGMVAHQGWLVAHGGLALDERRVIVQKGEGIIKAPTMDRYQQAGISFDDLNEGRLPVIASGGNNGGTTTIQGGISLNFPNVKNIDQQTIDRTILPAVNDAFYKRTGKRLF